jgi:hypothetical protein
MGRLFLILALALGGLGEGRAGAALPDDARLQPARAELEAAFSAAARAAVPESILVDKVKEGLAKGIPAVRIAQVVRTLEQSLAEAVSLSTPHFTPPPASLLKAIAAARSVGVLGGELETLLKVGAGRGAKPTTHALDVITDLAQHGYPTAVAVRAVTAVLNKNPRALDQVAPFAQKLSTTKGVTRSDALDAIGRAAVEGVGLDRASEALSRDSAPPDDRGPNRESSSERGPGNGRGKGHP